MASYDFDHPPDRRNTGSIKWDKYAGGDVLPMWVADMDFAAPPEVLEALRRRIDHGVLGYGMGPAELKPTIAAWLQRRHGWEVDPQCIVYVPGVMTGLSAALRATTAPGDLVATTVPIYPPFLTLPQHIDRRRADVPMLPAEDGRGPWKLDLDALHDVLGQGARALLWCNPHNPCGRIFGVDELRQVAQACLESGALILSDEIHADLLLSPGARHVPMATLSPQIAERTIVFMAPSKTFNIPGLVFSFAVITDDGLRGQFRKALRDVVPWPNILAYEAALAAYAHGDHWLDELLNYLRGNYSLLLEAVEGLGPVRMAPIEGTYLAWLDVRQLGLEKPGEHFERHGLGLMDGKEFGLPGYVRLNFACSRQLLTEAIGRLKRAVESA